MTATAPTRADLAFLDREIARALEALRAVRAASARSTIGATVHGVEEMAEWRLNRFLDRRYAAQKR